MECNRRPLPVPVAVLLAIALTASGVLVFIIPWSLIALIPRQPNVWLSGLVEFGIVLATLELAIVLGFVLAWLGSRVRAWRTVGLALCCAWLIASSALICFPTDFQQKTHVQLWILTTMWAFVCLPLTMCQVLFPFWMGRVFSDGDGHPLFFFGFVLLGYAIGLALLPSADSSFWKRDDAMLWTAICQGATCILFCVLFFLFIRMQQSRTDENESLLHWSPSPGLVRRLRWFLLGAIPSGAMIGVNRYVSAEIAPLPNLDFLAWSLFFISWVTAYVRMTRATVRPAGWLAQILAMAPLIWCTGVLREMFPGDADMHMPFFLAATLASIFAPHAFTLTMQGSLLAIALLQVFVAPSEFDTFWAILCHVSLGGVIAWGCHGDAVKNAPATDRLPEFVLCVHGGSFLGASAWLFLPELIFRNGIYEYPVALIAAFFVRACPWPMIQAHEKSPAA